MRKSKSENSLYYLELGDIYGSPFEMRGIRGETFDLNELPLMPIGLPTDDTKMAKIAYSFAQKCDKEKGIYLDIKGIKEEYIKWAREYGDEDGIGVQTEYALLYNSINKESQGNGSLMRCIPYMLLLNEKGFNDEEIFEMMREETTLTHPNKEVIEMNEVFYKIAKNKVINLQNINVTKIKYGKTAWIYYTAFIVIEALNKDFERIIDGFRYITALGGDTDTNCAIYGAIRGAWI